jgi:polyhydroxyalkanoate synthesis regulator protein
LTQIIVEQESSGGQNMLPTNFLRQLISFYGGNMQSVVPNYLEQTFDAFTKNQDQFRQMFAVPSSFTPATLEEMGRKNMALFENAMKTWGSSFNVDKK